MASSSFVSNSYSAMEGQSTARPPLFNGSNYSYWKTRMSVWIQGSDYDMWEVICNGPHIPIKRDENGDATTTPKEPKEFNETDKKNLQLNAKAISVLYCALDPSEFNRISACKSAKEIWDKLKVAHEGTSEVRETKMNMLLHDYELFKMDPSEDIKSMFTRFTTITNDLALFDKDLGNEEKVRKVLRSLPKAWRNIRTTIEEANILSTMTIETLQGKLLTHEIAMKGYESEDEKVSKKKSIALKSSHHEESESEDDDEDIAMLTRKFNKFLKKKNFKKQGGFSRNPRGEHHKNSFHSKRNDVICFGCSKPGHYKQDCPMSKEKSFNAKEKKKGKKAMVATWSDSDDESNKDSSDNEVANLCLMAQEDDDLQEVSSSSHCDLNNYEPSYDELEKAFDDLFSESKKLGTKNSTLKKLLASMTQEKENIEKALIALKDEHEILKNDFKTQKETFENEKNALSSKVDDLTKIRGKGVESTKRMYGILNEMRYPNNKTGLGFFDHYAPNKSLAPKVKKEECSTSYHNSYKPRETKYASRRSSLICHYCCKRGHHISRCFAKKNPSKWKWVVKGSNKSTNTYGPKKAWVPKSNT